MRASLLVAIVVGVFGCGRAGTEPRGSCQTGGSATGSFTDACNQCAKTSCDAELTQKAGSGWANQYFGGDGACAPFYACLCQCVESRQSAFCTPATCSDKLDAVCSDAMKAAQTCLDAHCAKECPG